MILSINDKILFQQEGILPDINFCNKKGYSIISSINS